mmetsp:Transcript_2376/g.4194  ORF Transcript_2376/g.4194 Transcript_2376/m.4194 type:complete len:427 (+) Transcript_2376:161-1441(+)
MPSNWALTYSTGSSPSPRDTLRSLRSERRVCSSCWRSRILVRRETMMVAFCSSVARRASFRFFSCSSSAATLAACTSLLVAASLSSDDRAALFAAFSLYSASATALEVFKSLSRSLIRTSDPPLSFSSAFSFTFSAPNASHLALRLSHWTFITSYWDLSSFTCMAFLSANCTTSSAISLMLFLSSSEFISRGDRPTLLAPSLSSRSLSTSLFFSCKALSSFSFSLVNFSIDNDDTLDSCDSDDTDGSLLPFSSRVFSCNAFSSLCFSFTSPSLSFDNCSIVRRKSPNITAFCDLCLAASSNDASNSSIRPVILSLSSSDSCNLLCNSLTSVDPFLVLPLFWLPLSDPSSSSSSSSSDEVTIDPVSSGAEYSSSSSESVVSLLLLLLRDPRLLRSSSCSSSGVEALDTVIPGLPTPPPPPPPPEGCA